MIEINKKLLKSVFPPVLLLELRGSWAALMNHSKSADAGCHNAYVTRCVSYLCHSLNQVTM